MKTNIHGYCPNCGVCLDGGLVLDSYLLTSNPSAAVEYCGFHAGYGEYGLANRWGRQIGIYSLEKDMTLEYECPDCSYRWDRNKDISFKERVK